MPGPVLGNGHVITINKTNKIVPNLKAPGENLSSAHNICPINVRSGFYSCVILSYRR